MKSYTEKEINNALDKYVKYTANFHDINYIGLTKFIFFTKFK